MSSMQSLFSQFHRYSLQETSPPKLQQLLQSNPQTKLRYPARSSKQLDHLSFLPLDVLLLITNYLPLESTAILAGLCSLTLLKKFGWQQLEALGFRDAPHEPGIRLSYTTVHRFFKPYIRSQQETQTRFLLLLERDIPGEIYCFACQYIHPPRETETNNNLACYTRHGSVLQYGTRFTHNNVRMAMKLYRRGRKSQLLKHFAHMTSTFPSTYEGHTCLVSLEPRIFSSQGTSKLLLKAEYRLSVPSTPSGAVTLPEHAWTLNICPHLRSTNLSAKHGITALDQVLTLWSGIYPWHASPEHIIVPRNFGCLRRGKQTFSCWECATQVGIELRCAVVGERSLELTVWQDLGRGERPEDHEWHSHFRDLVCGMWCGGRCRQGWWGEKGLIRREFEGVLGEGRCFEGGNDEDNDEYKEELEEGNEEGKVTENLEE